MTKSFRTLDDVDVSGKRVLLRVDLAEAAPLGERRGWRASFPVVQWSVTR